jgi:hypothetical protein
MENKYLEIKTEIEEFLKIIENDKEISEKLKKYFKGIQVFFSPLLHKPKFMFIGINPGAGFFNNEGNQSKNVKRLSPMEFTDYIGQKYKLATETRELFKLAGISNKELQNSVKSNYYFLATTNANDLFSLLSHLKKHKVYYKSKKWINKLIDIVEPEFIICEGKTVFDKLVKDRNCKISEIDGVYYTEIDKIKVIGYKRMFSNILNKEKVAKVLKEKLIIQP